VADKKRRGTPLLEEDQGRARRVLSKLKTPTGILAVLLVFLVVVYAVVLNAIRPHTPGREVSIDEVVQRIRDKEITNLTLLAEDHRMVGTDERGPWWTSVGPFDLLAEEILTDATTNGVTTRIDGQTGKNILKLATTFLLPVVSLVVLFSLMYSIRRGGGTEEFALLGRARANRYASEEGSEVTFADVAGADEAIQELKEVRDFLKSPEEFERMGAKPPRGVLLLGPPGCGKTLLAKAVAGEAGVPFFSVSASAFVEMLAGVGASRVRDLFQKARAAAPSIVFVDEIDAVGRARSMGDTGNAEGENTLNELLVQLDGFDAAQRVVLMAATNRADMLDSALMRKGRFDRHIVIDVPDFTGRAAIFRVHARGKPLAPDVDLDRFARRTIGMSGAEISAVMNEAATLATRKRKTEIGNTDISEAIERVIAGPEMHSRILGPEEKRRVAYHEAGHAIVGWVLNTSATVDKVSVVSRGHSLGGTWSLPTEDSRLRTRSQYEQEIASLVAGRSAELVVYGDPSGASSADLVRATSMARQMVYELGMSDDIGPVAISSRDGAYAPEHSDELTREADRAVRKMLEKGDERARAVITAYRQHLDRLAEQLVQVETLEHQDLQDLLGDLPKGLPPTPDVRHQRRSGQTSLRTG
jgi:cell division protease FtsH